MREAWCLKSIVLLGVIALALGTPFVPTAEATADPWTILVTTTLTEEHFGEIIIGADNITLDDDFPQYRCRDQRAQRLHQCGRWLR